VQDLHLTGLTLSSRDIVPVMLSYTLPPAGVLKSALITVVMTILPPSSGFVGSTGAGQFKDILKEEPVKSVSSGMPRMPRGNLNHYKRMTAACEAYRKVLTNR